MIAQLRWVNGIEPVVKQYFSPGDFELVKDGVAAILFFDSSDYKVTEIAIHDLAKDIGNVTLTESTVTSNRKQLINNVLIAGTIGHNVLIDKLIREGKIDTSGISGKWETFAWQVVEKPFENVTSALIIFGSDRRGTAYGIYELSEQIGVSPWYWWADVPVKPMKNLFIRPVRHSLGEPAVKYRGIFINDEMPALSGWAFEKFHGFNHKFYAHVFELILRLKGNYLWPAMWGRMFYIDDTLNPVLADEYAIVIGTSHHEPLMRAHEEWKKFGKGPWNYEKNDSVLREYWRGSIKRMDSYESIITIGMRGDGDMPMSEESNISLLERIVSDQRKILREVTGKDPSEIPQVWALYKEVQDYYDQGMRVPDDVTLLLCDDNWGNIRKLPRLNEKPRKGGYGIYYHFDYVGGPRNYKWINTNPIPKIWEQMHLAYEYGARQIWIVNVGDIKPMEFPISFFLDYAWNPEKIQAKDLGQYTIDWVREQFGDEYATEIAGIIAKYGKFNGRCKPELLSPETYSLINYREAETVVSDYDSLAAEAQDIYENLLPEYKDAYYQLVLYPVLASANINDLYVTVGKNQLYASQGRADANDLADKAKELFMKDAEFANYYNTVMAEGKWNHMMDQTNIGYTYWQQPEKDVMPEVMRIKPAKEAEIGIAIEGSADTWPGDTSEPLLPAFDLYLQQKYCMNIFNKGKTPFEYTVKPKSSWVQTSLKKGMVEKDQRIWINIDWSGAPEGIHRIPIVISGQDKDISVFAEVHDPPSPVRDQLTGFVESNGCISIEPEHYTNEVHTREVGWLKIPDYGRTLSAMTPFPVTAPSQEPGGNSPRLEYIIHVFDTGKVAVITYLSPTLNFHNDQGLRYAVSVDNETPQTVFIHKNFTFQDWEEAVRTNSIVKRSIHTIDQPGEHMLKIWMIDPAVVFQKIVLDLGGLKPSYLGPPESYHRQ